MEWINANWAQIVQIVSVVMLLSHLVTELTPTPKDDRVVKELYKFFELLGLKIGKSRESNRKS